MTNEQQKPTTPNSPSTPQHNQGTPSPQQGVPKQGSDKPDSQPQQK
jgi:hypothetical protein